MNIIDIMFYVIEKGLNIFYAMEKGGGEHHRYHVLCNGKGVNIIDMMFYVMEKGEAGD